MIVWGNRRRLCFSGWVLAALLLIGLNGFHLLALENQPLVGHSPTIKSLRRNLSQWESSQRAASGADRDIQRHPVLIRYAKPQEPPPAGSEPLPDEAPAAVTTERITLPVLAGIVQALDQQGRQSYRALLDGRVCRTNDKVGAFVVEQISPDGVVLNRAGRQWQIECPAPHYSKDQGN